MAVKHLEANVRRRGNVAILDLDGEIDAFGEQALSGAFAEALSEGPSAVLLNFSRVVYLNSTGIALIVGLVGRARRSQLPLILFGVSEHFQEIFRITRLVDYAPVFPDEECAVRAITV